MTELYLLLGFLTGAATVFFAMYPQMKLLKGIVADRHAGDLMRVGVRQSQVVPKTHEPVVTPETPMVPDVPKPPAVHSMGAPSILDRRANEEDKERKQLQQAARVAGQFS